MIVVGIDPGSKIAGFGVLQLPKLGSSAMTWRNITVRDAGAIRVKAEQSPASKLWQISDAVQSIVSTYKADCLVLESAFFGINARSALKLGEVRGAVVARLAREPVALFEVSPSFVKKQVAGHGQASKDEVKTSIATLLNIQLGDSPHDVSDALAIALAFGLSCRGRSPSAASAGACDSGWLVDAGIHPLGSARSAP